MGYNSIQTDKKPLAEKKWVEEGKVFILEFTFSVFFFFSVVKWQWQRSVQEKQEPQFSFLTLKAV